MALFRSLERVLERKKMKELVEEIKDIGGGEGFES
jgi:hypothetical protein